MTATIATESSGSPAMNARIAATQSMIAKKCVSSPSSRRTADGRRAAGSRLAPPLARRSVASAVVSPGGAMLRDMDLPSVVPPA